MRREVFALTGGATPPPLVPEASVNKGYKENRQISDKMVSWYTQHSCAVYHWGSSVSSVRCVAHDSRVVWGNDRVWKPIVHPARSGVDRDKPFLSHWVKAGEEDVEYPWAKFNKKLAIPKYTDEQYTKHFQGEQRSTATPPLLLLLTPIARPTDNDWTREETDTLFDLCEQFDLRFIVIHDRFPNPKRTIEVCPFIPKPHHVQLTSSVD
jgi:hypothetical protein